MTKPTSDTARASPFYGATGASLDFSNHLKDIVARFDRALRHTFVNRAVESATGVSVENFLGKTNREMGMPAELVHTWELAIGDVFRTGLSAEINFSFDGPAGVRHFTSFLAPETDAKGQVQSVVSIARDVTETIELRKRVWELPLAAHFQAIVNSSEDAIISKSLDGIVISWNGGAEAIFGYTESEMCGQPLLILFPPDRRDEERFILEKLMEGEAVEHFETVRVRKDGSLVNVSVTISPVRDATGKIVGASKIARDISARIELEAAHREHAMRLKRVIEGANEAFWDLDLLTQYAQVSDYWGTMLGYAPGELDFDGNNWLRFLHADDVAPVQQALANHVSGITAHYQVELRCLTKQGQWRWIESRGRVVEWTADGRPWKMSGTCADITERKVFELAQNEANTVFSSSYEGIMVVDANQTILKVNPAFTRITGYTAEEVIGASPHMLSSEQHDQAFYRAMWEAIREKGFWTGEIWNRRKSGEIYAEHLSITAVTSASGAIQHYVGVFSDISQLKAHEAQLDRVAHYDPLTGLPNRRLLRDRLDRAILHSARGGTSLAVCYLDLDGFKAINDTYGHQSGDLVLQGVTAHMQQVMRADDTLARLGGDEFVMLMANINSPQECSLILERVLSAISQPVQVEGTLVAVSASIGVSLYPDDHADADTLLRHADQAMYVAKEAGKNRFHLYEPDNDRKAQDHRIMLARLRLALQNHEFVLHYQPQVDLANGALIGFEALIRWIDPTRGLIPPTEFLPLVYGSSLENALGQWVLHNAVQQATQWLGTAQSVPISVNISAAHLMNADFVASLSSLLAQHPGLPANLLKIEILETAAIGDIGRGISVIEQCRALGVQFALDDFGTGYSSLTYLRRLPVDMLKIDQSFVRDMLRDQDDLGIVEGVIHMARAFKRSVIAEGVETMAHGDQLVRLGCTLAQGYGIARPMPADAIESWVAQWALQQPWASFSPHHKP